MIYSLANRAYSLYNIYIDLHRSTCLQLHATKSVDFWSLARLIDLTKSQKKKKSLHLSTCSRDYRPGSLIGAHHGIVVLTDLVLASADATNGTPQRRERPARPCAKRPWCAPLSGGTPLHYHTHLHTYIIGSCVQQGKYSFVVSSL